MKKLITTGITYLLAIFLLGQSIALAQQVVPSTPPTRVGESNTTRLSQLTTKPSDMMRARIPQAKALDEPMLSIGYMGNIAPFYVQRDDPSSGRSISITHSSRYLLDVVSPPDSSSS